MALAPVLAWQAAGVVRRIPRLPEAAGPRQGEVGDGPLLKLLIVGDSSAAGVGADDQARALSGALVAALAGRYRVRWRLIARSGATTAACRALLTGEPAAGADVAVTALGLNDVKNGVPLRRFLAATEALHTNLRRVHGAHRILVSGLPPVRHFPSLPDPLRSVLADRADRFEQALRQRIAGRRGKSYLPLDFLTDATLMARDGFHPGPEIYRAWGARLADLVD